MTNFTDELDEGFVQQMLDVFVKVIAVDAVDLSRNLELATGSPGDLDGSVYSFFRRNPPKKEQIVLRLFLKAETIGGQSTVNRPHPISLRQRAPLRFRTGDNGPPGTLVVTRRPLGHGGP